MILTISFSHHLADDICLFFDLSQKSLKTFKLDFGIIHVFCTRTPEQTCTIAFLLEITNFSKYGNQKWDSTYGFGCFVKDRVYVLSPLLIKAIDIICRYQLDEKNSEILNRTLSYKITIPTLQCQEGEYLVRQFFEPLGYKVVIKNYLIDTKFPEWGFGTIYRVELCVSASINEIIKHLSVLIPAFGDYPAYGFRNSPIETLKDSWLKYHPQRELITARYFRYLQDTSLEKNKIRLGVLSQRDSRIKEDNQISIRTHLIGEISITKEYENQAKRVIKAGVNPNWIIYLPPTMPSLISTSQPEFLEHPNEIFEYYKTRGVKTIILERKETGIRVVAIICKDSGVASRCFGVQENVGGVLYSRTGQRIFDDTNVEIALINQIRSAIEISGTWEKLKTDWVCLDCELMPLQFDQREDLKKRYAQIGLAGVHSLNEVVKQLRQTKVDGKANEVLMHFDERLNAVKNFVKIYQQYCCSTKAIENLRLVPFHIMATEGRLHTNKDHFWHLETISKIVKEIPNSFLGRVEYRVVDLNNLKSQKESIDWWEEINNLGGEGIVAKPQTFIVKKQGNLLQPAIKCRGREFLRLTFGPEYTDPISMRILREQNVVGKQIFSLKEFSLGIEAMTRFIQHESKSRIQECIFGIVALEIERGVLD